ncbi:unnamed protein product [Adineta ricciae]|uniref:Uncharacterized protein n=1 Tax=Adineta ricciae TaxID=249248 RepID=A0A814WM99_ADIRI|nr:unnamed protein product [Adineta ricciae]
MKANLASRRVQTVAYRHRSANPKDENFVSKVYYNSRLEETIATLEQKSRADFSYWNLVDDDMSTIVTRVVNGKQCTELDFCGNKFTCKGISILAYRLPNNSTLKSLDLSYNFLRDSGIYLLSEVLLPEHCVYLRKLVLNKNGITNDGVKYIATMLKSNHMLTELWLSNNEIGNDGIKQLANVLIKYNRTLKLLVLSFNVFITDESADYLVEVLERNQTLVKLGINNCNLSEIGKAKLRQIVNTKTKFKMKI